MSSPDKLQKTVGHKFRNPELLTRALTHRSAGSANNERLEYLGDSIIGFFVAEALFQRFPKATEGDLSRMRARLVRGKTLAILARELEIQNHVVTGPGERKSGGFNRDSILANTFEALIGAVYLDNGMDRTREVLKKLYRHQLEIISPKNMKDGKSMLQELLQKDGRELPRYRLLEQTGDGHEPEFRVECVVPGFSEGFVATAKSIKQAEQKAASLALAALEDEG